MPHSHMGENGQCSDCEQFLRMTERKKKKVARKVVSMGQVCELMHQPVSDKVVLLGATNWDVGGTDWFMIGLDDSFVPNNTNEEKLKEMIIDNNNIIVYPALRAEFGSGCCWAIMGSTLYAIGGLSFCNGDSQSYSREVYMFNVNNPHDGFIKAPPMIRERSWSNALPLDGKLFVFGGDFDGDDDHWGGDFDGDDDHWGEYFDPTLNKWNPIPAPPFVLSASHAIPYDDKHIMLGTPDGRIWLYNVEFHSWECLPNTSYHNCCSNGYDCVKVGNIVYWLSGRLYAYDLDTEKTYSGVVKGSVLQYQKDIYEEDRSEHPTPLFHCGGNVFCFFWYDFIGDENVESTVFHCERVKVAFPPCGHLEATVISSQSYVSDQDLRLVDAMLVNREFVENFISKTEEMFSGSSSGGTKRSYASALVAGLERLSIKDPGCLGNGKDRFG